MSASPAEPRADAEARRCIRESLDRTLVVEAAAGTGKTTELIARIVAIIGEGHGRLDQIIAVTFTELAAGEMKLRLRSELDVAREAATGVRRARYEGALSALEAARIGTIHSLCADLLRERPIEAKIDPGFTVLGDSERDRLLERAFDAWFAQALADPPEGLRRALAVFRERPRERLLSAARDLVDRRDFDAPWERPAFDREPRIDGLFEEIAELGDMAAGVRGRGAAVEHLAELRRFAEQVQNRELHRPRDYDTLEAELRALSRDRAWRRKGGTKALGEALAERREALGRALQAFAEAAEEDLAAALHEALQEVVAEYVALRRKAGALDFLDLLLATRDLLREHEAVRRAWQQRFSHVFVDEFQDTDPLQAEILLLLSSDDPGVAEPSEVRPTSGKLFVVGDPKQAIYRFRRADVALYERVKQQLIDRGATLLHLSTSFRGVPELQSAVNAAFEPLMQRTEDGSQAHYVPLERHRPSREGQPAVVALPIPDPYGGWGRITHKAIDASAPEAVGSFVRWLVEESGWRVEERGEEVPLSARHVCLLFRRMRGYRGMDVTRPYVRALENRRVAHVLVGGRSLFAREEVVALRAAVDAIEWPDDTANVYATLRGPFFSFSDDVLLAHIERGGLHPLRVASHAHDDERIEAVRGVLELLGTLHRRRNRAPIADTILRLLEASRAHASIAIWPNGEQALANVLRIVEEARRFDARATSFRAFASWLDAQEARQQTGDAPVVEEGTDGVRIMTVHRAKGLEFPVVILCDPTAPRESRHPSRHVDNETRRWAASLAGLRPRELRAHETEVLAQDTAELVRLTYVAATRARDVLVVPCVGDERRDGWVALLHDALYPPVAASAAARPAPGCPWLGTETVRHRDARAMARPDESVAPGLHEPKAGEHEVVWWGVDALELEVDAAGGLRQMELLVSEPAGESEAGARAYRRWADRRAQALRRGAMSEQRAVTVTARSHETPEPDREVEIVTLGSDAPTSDRPRGARFGSLVHAVLAEIPLDADPASIGRVAGAQARLLGADDVERDAASELVRRALTHPLLRRAAASADCRREVPVSTPLPDGRLLEGVVDLAFVDDGRFVVVDYKTDVGALPPHYLAQVALYASAIAEATRRPAHPTLLQL